MITSTAAVFAEYQIQIIESALRTDDGRFERRLEKEGVVSYYFSRVPEEKGEP